MPFHIHLGSNDLSVLFIFVAKIVHFVNYLIILVGKRVPITSLDIFVMNSWDFDHKLGLCDFFAQLFISNDHFI